MKRTTLLCALLVISGCGVTAWQREQDFITAQRAALRQLRDMKPMIDDVASRKGG